MKLAGSSAIAAPRRVAPVPTKLGSFFSSQLAVRASAPVKVPSRTGTIV